MNDERVIWIKTEPSVDGSTYVVTAEFSDDRAITLTPDSVMRYARTVYAAAGRAEYDAAVFRQLSALGLDQQVVGQLIVDLREDRPDLDAEATKPLELRPGVNPQGKPFLGLYLDGEQYGQWDVEDARGHASHAVEAVEAADLDAGYFRALIGIVNLDEPRARNVVGDLAEHR